MISGSDELAFLADAHGALPHATVRDRQSIAVRHRDKQVLADLLERLLERDPEVAAAVDDVVAALSSDPVGVHELLERQNHRLAFWRTAAEQYAETARKEPAGEMAGHKSLLGMMANVRGTTATGLAAAYLYVQTRDDKHKLHHEEIWTDNKRYMAELQSHTEELLPEQRAPGHERPVEGRGHNGDHDLPPGFVPRGQRGNG